MFQEPDTPIAEQIIADGLAARLDSTDIDSFIGSPGLRVLFFPGPTSVRREAHDVAVALRELLKDYRGNLEAGVVADSDACDAALRDKLRVSATPCICFAVEGEVLESLPRVRDWADYHAAFQRYLGTPDRVTNLMESA
jgi:hypothetical protein